VRVIFQGTGFLEWRRRGGDGERTLGMRRNSERMLILSRIHLLECETFYYRSDRLN
jgi:hypothetical protein